MVDGVVDCERIVALRGFVGPVGRGDSSRDAIDKEAGPLDVLLSRERNVGRGGHGDAGCESVSEEMGGRQEVILCSVGLSCNHQRILCGPPCGRKHDLVGGGGKCGVEIGDDFLWCATHGQVCIPIRRVGHCLFDHKARPSRSLGLGGKSGVRRGGSQLWRGLGWGGRLGCGSLGLGRGFGGGEGQPGGLRPESLAPGAP